MIESNINEGRQDVPEGGAEQLRHGISITDGCVNWDATVTMLDDLNKEKGAHEWPCVMVEHESCIFAPYKIGL
jgi:phospho-2-dehydro-3-deoxyheptonate aldolase